MSDVIIKIGLAVVEDGRLLVVRKRGGRTFILAGGKPEPGEDDLAALRRELAEEIRCDVADPWFEGEFHADAADLADRRVAVRLYSGTLVGTPRIDGEIEELAWAAMDGTSTLPLAASITDLIIPHLTRTSA